VGKWWVVGAAQGLFFHCRANGFLHHMVRNMVGSLVRVGKSEERPEWIKIILETGDRRISGMTAPAMGLTLMEIGYPPDALGTPFRISDELRDT